MRLDGTVVASARFSPRHAPVVGGMPILQDEARIARGSVFYADGAGVIRTLSADGHVTEVGRLAIISSQQELSFVVRPDGRVIDAAILTLPPVASKPRQSLNDPIWGPGSASIDLYQILVGQPPTLVFHKEFDQGKIEAWPSYQAVGFDRLGIYTIPTALGTQQPYNGQHWFGPAVHYIASAGGPIPIGGSGCFSQASNGVDVYICVDTSMRNPSLRHEDGTEVAVFPTGADSYGYFTFSPAGDRLAYFKFAQTSPATCEVIDLTGTRIAVLNSTFRPRAWLDETTVLGDEIEIDGGRQLSYVNLSEPDRVRIIAPVLSFSIVGALAPSL
jgi:hypothetical protein